MIFSFWISGCPTQLFSLHITIKNVSEEKILDITIDTKLTFKKKINTIHEKSLILVLYDRQSTLDEMLDSLNEKTVHQQCIDRLLTKV